MAKIRSGDKVKLHFTGTLPDGRVFDSTGDGGDRSWEGFRGQAGKFGPLELEVGVNRMLPAFEEKLVGMEPGQEITFTVKCEDAFGPRHPEWVMEIPREEITPAQHHLINFRVAEGRRHANTFKPQVGDELMLEREDGTVVRTKVKAMTPETITIDANHPLSGYDLTFNVHIVGIQ